VSPDNPDALARAIDQALAGGRKRSHCHPGDCNWQESSERLVRILGPLVSSLGRPPR